MRHKLILLFIAGCTAVSLLFVGLMIAARWRSDRWEFGRWSLFEAVSDSRGFGLNWCRRYALREEFVATDLGDSENFNIASTGELLAPYGWLISDGRWYFKHGTGGRMISSTSFGGGWVVTPISASFDFETFNGINGGTFGPTDWTTSYRLRLPHWWIATAFALPLAVCLIVRLRRWRRWRDASKCAACGYDLRATPERCPECGTVAMQFPLT